MDYAFYLQKILDLPDELHTKLKCFVQTSKLDPKTSYFVPGRHPGLASGGFVVEQNTPPVIHELIDCLGEIFPKKRLLSYAINCLDIGGYMHEHTDATGGAQSKGMFINSQHLIHVQVTGGAEFGFRRSQSESPENLRMDSGGVYALNNYVFHTARNFSQEKRYNILVYYADPDWQIKQRVYTKLGLVSTTY